MEINAFVYVGPKLIPISVGRGEFRCGRFGYGSALIVAMTGVWSEDN
jgi:hypothetical protein